MFVIFQRLRAGVVDEIEIEEAKEYYNRIKSLIPPLEQRIEELKNKLSFLLGKAPGYLDKLLSRFNDLPDGHIEIVIGIPAEVFKNRPDVRRAEQELISATYSIGEAKSELYPKLTLAGSIGLEALKIRDLFEWASRFWNLGAIISWRIFDAGQIAKNVKVRTLRQKQALLNYKKPF